MVPDEVSREGAIESFDVSVHLGRPWVRVKVRDEKSLARILEPSCKFTAVVRLDLGDVERCDCTELREKVRRRGR